MFILLVLLMMREYVELLVDADDQAQKDLILCLVYSQSGQRRATVETPIVMDESTIAPPFIYAPVCHFHPSFSLHEYGPLLHPCVMVSETELELTDFASPCSLLFAIILSEL